jgi:prepilin-type N-terminal cleavage/methylation domain-containing protein/prepilin-type processing-associated H-X9-DG protein
LRGALKFLRAWIDSSGKSRNNVVALPMPAMEAEMKIQRTTRDGRGFTLTELLVVICLVAMVAVLLLPALVDSKRKSSRVGCVNNLEELALGFKMWAGDNGDKYPTHFAVTNDAMMKLISSGNAYTLWQTMTNELSTPKILHCPADTNKIAATDFTVGFSDANISYFFSLDADETHPQMILAGDDNLVVNGVRVRSGILNLWTNAAVGWTKERHGGAGNVALADGSAQQLTSSSLLRFVQQTGVATNRLVIP